MQGKTYRCPCCGYLVFDKPPGSLEICQICFWQDNPVALRYATTPVDGVPLIDAQKTYARVGASEERFLPDVRKAFPYEVRDPEWRPADPQRDVFDTTYYEEGPTEWPEDLESLYYWRDNYWMRRT